MLRLEPSNLNNLLSMTHILDPANNETSTNFTLQIEKILEKRQAIAEKILIKIQSQVEEKLQRVSIYTQEATTRNFGH